MLRISYLFLIAFLVLSCNHKEKNEEIYNFKYYNPITSSSDSAKNMYVVYNSTIDSNYKMFKFYWDNGNIQTISFFYKKMKIGPWKSYFDNGKPSSVQYFNDGRRDGEYKLYYMNGQINVLGTYHQDVKIGNWYYFKENGDTLKIENYKK